MLTQEWLIIMPAMRAHTNRFDKLVARLAAAFVLAVWPPTVLTAQHQTPPKEASQRPPDETSPPEPVQTEQPQQTEQKPHITLDLSNPRSAMKAFLVAIEDAKGDRPDRIDDAVRCLDTSELEGEDIVTKAQSLALRLHALIDRIGVKLQDIPDQADPGQRTYLFHAFEQQEGEDFAPEIGLVIGPDSQWRFTARTLASIPVVEKRPPEAAEPEPAAEDTAVPAARRTPRATMKTFIEAMNAEPPDFEQAIACLNPVGQDTETWTVVGRELASKLKNVMDKVAVVVYTDIPDAPADSEYVWYTSNTGNIVIGKVLEKPAELAEDWQYTPLIGEWRFTPKTFQTLTALYQEFEDEDIVRELREAGVQERLTFGMWIERHMPGWLRAELLGLQGWQWLALAALIPAGWLARVIASAVADLLLKVLLRRKRIGLEPQMQRRAMWWLGAVAAVLVWYWSIQALGLPPLLFGLLFRAAKFLLVVTAVWAGYRLVDILGGYITRNKEIRLTEIDEVLIPLLSNILRILVVVVVFLFVLQWMDIRITPIIGALGVGGVALAFAAQDTLNNFFGSVTVLFDRPFGIGDWIVIGDIEGTVERVGFRSTRVRTFYNSMVTIPNSRMVNTHVDNYGARRYRRIRINISITYSTPPEKIDAFCEGIRELVRLHPYTRKDYYHVYLNQFAASSLDILLYLFLEAPDWSTELRERHRLFVDIIRLARRLGVEFAFPTQTVWLERAAKETVAPEPVAAEDADPEEIGCNEAARAFQEAYGEEPTHRPPVVIDATPRSRRKKLSSSDQEETR